MNAQSAMYEFMRGIISIIFTDFRVLIYPFLVLHFALWFYRWVFSRRNGSNADEMSSEWNDLQSSYWQRRERDLARNAQRWQRREERLSRSARERRP